jgi:BlaR1 peptidase M56
MDREWLLALLIAAGAGVALQAGEVWPDARMNVSSAFGLERDCWMRIWRPAVPAVLVAAWLCGWAVVEPDPVPERVSKLFILSGALFALLFLRAAVRAIWSILPSADDRGMATVGLIRPSIRASRTFAESLDEPALEAAFEHERAHARHRDPLRIWLVQFVTDLQWPSPRASHRFHQWLAALELARDEEAREFGANGSDLAKAILASIRLLKPATISPKAALLDDQTFLKERIARLLRPLDDQPQPHFAPRIVATLLAPAFLSAMIFGVLFGESVMHRLLGL